MPASSPRFPNGFWLVERNVGVDGRRIPFLVIGATGVFLICASDGAWTLDDLHVMSELGDQVGKRMPGYDGEPHAAVCLAFDEMKPRTWFGGEEVRGHGGWVLGVDWLQRWIFGFGPEYGLRNGDVRALDEAVRPVLGSALDRPPSDHSEPRLGACGTVSLLPGSHASCDAPSSSRSSARRCVIC